MEHYNFAGDNKAIEFQYDSISPLNSKCQTSKAKRLCIFDASYKLENRDHYDIGGTYTGDEPDLWFFFTSSKSLKNQYLLNLFVYHRKPGYICIGILKAIKKVLCVTDEINNKTGIRGKLEWKNFVSPRPNITHHVTTYCLPDLNRMDDLVLCIPIVIEINPTGVNKLASQRIKLNYNMCNMLDQSKTDFILESSSRTQYHTHKIVLAAHSPVLMEIVKKEESNTAFLNISDQDMTLLLEFLNDGSIKDMEKQDVSQMLDLCEKFKLERLKYFIEKMLAKQLNIENAIDFAVLSEKHQLEKIKKIIFLFIRLNPKVMDTEGWNKLEDINLTKKLCKEVFRMK